MRILLHQLEEMIDLGTKKEINKTLYHVYRGKNKRHSLVLQAEGKRTTLVKNKSKKTVKAAIDLLYLGSDNEIWEYQR